MSVESDQEYWTDQDEPTAEEIAAFEAKNIHNLTTGSNFPPAQPAHKSSTSTEKNGSTSK